ncbi:hypothetical protein FB451DRAFT_394964 [Mycena latifolia]|nr:hypothetical protein FB451DRAFT_394964 [Mycena latifolia]
MLRIRERLAKRARHAAACDGGSKYNPTRKIRISPPRIYCIFATAMRNACGKPPLLMGYTDTPPEWTFRYFSSIYSPISEKSAMEGCFMMSPNRLRRRLAQRARHAAACDGVSKYTPTAENGCPWCSFNSPAHWRASRNCVACEEYFSCGALSSPPEKQLLYSRTPV